MPNNPAPHPLRCRCGTVQGEVTPNQTILRAVCYCRDCQAFARFLGEAAPVLNPHGGTPVVASVVSAVRFTAGADQLACMSLSNRGLYRWYAACCRTPIGNTPRGRGMPYLGLVEACLPGGEAALQAAFGPSKMVLQGGSAQGSVQRTPWAAFAGVLRLMSRMAAARLRGAGRDNPFLEPGSNAPIRPVQVLTLAQRQAVTPVG